jgi:Subtilase family
VIKQPSVADLNKDPDPVITPAKENSMKYLVLRRLLDTDAGEFTERVAAGASDAQLPFAAQTHELKDTEAADLRGDPATEEVIPSIPFTLIKPVSESKPGPVTGKAWGIEAVGADNCAQDGDGVTVAVLDTGINESHAAFAGLKFEPNDLMDFTTDERGLPGSAPDVDGHGTHVAGTIFGRDVGNTRIGVARGVSKVLIGKILGPMGAPTETIYNAIDWALQRRADVVSMSLNMDFPGLVRRFEQDGFPQDIAVSRTLEAYRSNVRLFDRLADLVKARVARGRGALLVAASGNDSRRSVDSRFTVAAGPPGAADGFISVGALQNPLAVAPFSNTGCLLSAPGQDIVSAKRGGGLETLSGTSMATPHVAGVIALWVQKLFPSGYRPNGWAADVQRAIENSIKSVPRHGRNDVGLGMVQAPK